MKEYEDTFLGFVGLVVALVPQYIEAIETGIRLIAAAGGLALLYYSIQHKRLLIKRDKEQQKHDEKDN